MALPLFLLALLVADPATPAPATSDAVVATAPTDAAAPPAAGPASADIERLPQGAPADDFAFVAWCHGVLSGHMDLAQRVKEILPLDDVQQKVGSAYLRGYEEALSKAPEGATAEGQERAKAAQMAGFNNWEPARNADKQLAADTYLGYQLPGRCEHAAIRLSGNPALFKMAPTVSEVATGAGRGGVSPDQLTAAAEARAVRPAVPVAAPQPAPTVEAAPAQDVPTETPAAEPAAVVAEAAPVAVEPEAAPMTEAAPEAEPAAAPAAEPEAAPVPEPAPATVAEAEPVPAAEETGKGKLVNMPKKGHLLPGFLRQRPGPARP